MVKSCSFEKRYIKGQFGKYYVRTVGVGKPMIIINGGPGLEYTYMYDWLLQLSNIMQLIFYDQYGSGRDIDNPVVISAELLEKQLVELVQIYNGNVDILAHSWGTYLALSILMKERKDIKVDNLVLINPCPLTYERFANGMARLISQLPDDIRNQIDTMEQSDTKSNDLALEVMKMVLPYYVFDTNNVPGIELNSYNENMNSSVYKSFEGFDQTNAVKYLPDKVLLILGKKDFFLPEDTIELHSHCTKVVCYNDCGHFAFGERNDDFLRDINEFLGG